MRVFPLLAVLLVLFSGCVDMQEGAAQGGDAGFGGEDNQDSIDGGTAAGEALCGNGEIDNGENCENCPGDVKCTGGEVCEEGKCSGACGNGQVDSGEDCENCPADFRCGAGKECFGGVCREICGNSQVDSGEDCENCPADAGCGSGGVCIDTECVQKNIPISTGRPGGSSAQMEIGTVARVVNAGDQILVDGKGDYDGDTLKIVLEDVMITGEEYVAVFELYDMGGELIATQLVMEESLVDFYEDVGDAIDAHLYVRKVLVSA